MADPEDQVLEHLRAIRAAIERIDRKIDRMVTRVECRSDGAEDRADEIARAILTASHILRPTATHPICARDPLSRVGEG
ncbi:hypothetical protein SAMN02799631_00145 [Methylobacterium sp. 174MFSha1.1]|uniref:hypothetical protein n=1 Tax=Methylobacterium sp. 174MFSha1.1 TaxID=1502749 RepID=UPI0008EF1F90|nr:hypothetical protein [Methylobacterium sp. 174MFSha1.1]SFU32650.1 hypothetical protein SAMN02799631_00145 [Methylobacterium sp. 174MFSha1.1]